MSTTPIVRLADDLADRTGRGSVQLSLDAPLRRQLVQRLVRARIEEDAERAASRPARPH